MSMCCCCFKLTNEWVEWEHDLKLFAKGQKALKENMGGVGDGGVQNSFYITASI